MAIKYRQNRDEKVDLGRTQSSFSDDPKLNKAKQISRRNDDVQNFQVGLYDIDLAFKDFLEKDVIHLCYTFSSDTSCIKSHTLNPVRVIIDSLMMH